MKYLPFRQIVYSIILPVLLYVWGVPFCEQYLTQYHQNQIQSILLQSDKSLFDGEVSVTQVVRDNVSNYVEQHLSFSLFSVYSIKILSTSGECVYPAPVTELSIFDVQQKIAAENYRLLDQGLSAEVTLYAGPNAPLSLGALVVFCTLTLGGLYIVYRRQVRFFAEERRERELTITTLKDGEKSAENELESLVYRQEVLKRNLKKARTALSESNESQTGMLEEIEVLEALLEENEELRVRQKDEIKALAKSIAEHPPIKAARSGKRKSRERDAISKRLKTLYKELQVHDRALKGFLDLEEGMRLKCEEVIHQLNGEPDLVTVKRKVFGGKGCDTFFETEFAYKGRLYFMRHPGGKVEVVAIGTKNTQATELGFLSRLSGDVKPV